MEQDKIYLVFCVTYDYYRFDEFKGAFYKAKDAFNFAEKNNDNFDVFAYEYGDETEKSLNSEQKCHYMIQLTEIQ